MILNIPNFTLPDTNSKPGRNPRPETVTSSTHPFQGRTVTFRECIFFEKKHNPPKLTQFVTCFRKAPHRVFTEVGKWWRYFLGCNQRSWTKSFGSFLGEMFEIHDNMGWWKTCFQVWSFFWYIDSFFLVVQKYMLFAKEDLIRKVELWKEGDLIWVGRAFFFDTKASGIFSTMKVSSFENGG